MNLSHLLNIFFNPVVSDVTKQSLSINPIITSTQTLRGRGVEHLDAIYAAMPYEDNPELHRLIHLFKYRRVRSLGEQLGQLMIEAIQSGGWQADALCPVPLHWTRRFDRGFNQSALLARSIGMALNIPVVPFLKRSRRTGRQAVRGRDERLQAVRGAFHLTRQPKVSHVVLIDDLATTGATMDACAQVLKEAGVERVEGWAVGQS